MKWLICFLFLITSVKCYGISGYSSVDKVKIWDGTDQALVDSSGNVMVNIAAGSQASPTTAGDDVTTVTTAGTRVQFASHACKYAIISAYDGNTNAVTIGGSTVVGAAGTRRGEALLPGQTERFDVSNTNLLYADSITNGDKCTYAYFN